MDQGSWTGCVTAPGKGRGGFVLPDCCSAVPFPGQIQQQHTYTCTHTHTLTLTLTCPHTHTCLALDSKDSSSVPAPSQKKTFSFHVLFSCTEGLSLSLFPGLTHSLSHAPSHTRTHVTTYPCTLFAQTRPLFTQ